MCGITAFFARESIPDYKHLDTLFRWSENRGKDGFGFVRIIKDEGTRKIFCVHKNPKPYSECKEEIRQFFKDDPMSIGELVIAISRAAPETEPATDPEKINQTLQPIISKDKDLVVVHNGAVSNAIHQNLKTTSNEYGYEFQTDIDSEAILASYVLQNRNMKDAMEILSGGYAAIMYDQKKDMLYTVNDFKPIAHGYIRGVGFILHSDNDAIGEVVQDITGCTRDGIAMWETWYHHYLSGGRIKEIDLDSGFMRNIKYSPRYITQNWDSNNPKVETDEELCLVAASGGLDSSLTLSMLKKAGYNNIIACHFDYGHRGGIAERMAITNVCNELDIPIKHFNLCDLMMGIDETSMLIDTEAKITTGTAEGLKKLDAWVNMRNTQFLTWMSTFAESEVMKHDYKKVYFLGGFLNLSESGHYPDNSEYFLSSFLDHLKYGSLIGNRVTPLFGLSNLMKHELFALIKHFKLEKVYRHTISCDRPIMKCDCDEQQADKDDLYPANCSKNGIPACGSGLLSYWASKMVGMDDMTMRNYYEVDDEDYEAHIPGHLKSEFHKVPKINEIIDRILFPEDKLDNLRKELKEINI